MVIFELFEGVVFFELLDQPSTWSSLNSLWSSNSSKAWSSFQAFYMHFGSVNKISVQHSVCNCISLFYLNGVL